GGSAGWFAAVVWPSLLSRGRPGACGVGILAYLVPRRPHDKKVPGPRGARDQSESGCQCSRQPRVQLTNPGLSHAQGLLLVGNGQAATGAVLRAAGFLAAALRAAGLRAAGFLAAALR